jgi:putative transposase
LGGRFPQKLAPELNPIERLWEHLKADLKWASFQTLAQLQTKVDQLLAELTPEVTASITGYSFILDALSALNTV